MDGHFDGEMRKLKLTVDFLGFHQICLSRYRDFFGFLKKTIFLKKIVISSDNWRIRLEDFGLKASLIRICDSKRHTFQLGEIYKPQENQEINKMFAGIEGWVLEF